MVRIELLRPRAGSGGAIEILVKADDGGKLLTFHLSHAMRVNEVDIYISPQFERADANALAG